MVQFEILAGRQAGTTWVARRFPVRVGRAPANNLRLDDAGVWAEHLELAFDPAAGFALTVRPDALASVNGQPCQSAVLRNGDVVEVGSARLRFWLSPTRQARLGLRETAVWLALVAVAVGQIGLIRWLAGQ